MSAGDGFAKVSSADANKVLIEERNGIAPGRR
jgi:hypothetical protein